MSSLTIYYKKQLIIMPKGENKNLVNKELAENIKTNNVSDSKKETEVDKSEVNKKENEEKKSSSKKEDDKENIVSKHKQSGKHSLQYDTIFKGKKDNIDEDTDTSTTYHNDSFNFDPSSNYHHETVNNHDYLRERKLKQKVYDILVEHTEINFMNNRRKPSRVDFNEYYRLLKENLEEDNFTSIEVFNELAYYFSDNLFNMFKLLEQEWINLIINELQDHIGKTPNNSKEVIPKNLSINSEIEFYTKDLSSGEEIIVTGIIKEQNHDDKTYTVDSYESVYEVHIDDIESILNNTKFKYNLNKLNNIDFL